MKKVSIILALAVLLTGSALGFTAIPSQAQFLAPVPQPAPVVGMAPWVGNNTPWVFYNGDWFRNGTLYYFFGPKHGWAPYYAYGPTYVVRPAHWYGPQWHTWYQTHPAYWQRFHQAYPYWHEHRAGHHYDEAFYNRYHHGQGRGWYGGYHGQP